MGEADTQAFASSSRQVHKGGSAFTQGQFSYRDPVLWWASGSLSIWSMGKNDSLTIQCDLEGQNSEVGVSQIGTPLALTEDYRPWARPSSN